MKRLRNKKAIITGVGDGIERGLAKAIGVHSAKAALCDTNQETLSETAQILKNLGVAVVRNVKEAKKHPFKKEFDHSYTIRDEDNAILDW